MAAALAAAGLVLTPAFATGFQGKKRPAPIALSFDRISSFTPANGDPKLAAALAGKNLALDDFKFTPAASQGPSVPGPGGDPRSCPCTGAEPACRGIRPDHGGERSHSDRL